MQIAKQYHHSITLSDPISSSKQIQLNHCDNKGPFGWKDGKWEDRKWKEDGKWEDRKKFSFPHLYLIEKMEKQKDKKLFCLVENKDYINLPSCPY